LLCQCAGYAGVINVAGVRIGGLSGIYKARDFNRGHYEHPPYSDDTKRSVYHVRNVDVFRLKQLKQHVDIFLSHDWPRRVYRYGNCEWLLKKKPFFRDEVASDSLGSPAAEDLLFHLKPTYWFSAHLHVKFSALIEHKVRKQQ
jgi:lariat debranching enzyme